SARHELGLAACVEILPPLSPEDFRQQLQWADVAVDTAVLPSSPRTILGLQAAGLPVVTTQPPPGEPETVLAIPARDPEALCDSLTLLARDESLRDRLVEAGLRRTRHARPAPTEASPRFAFGENWLRFLEHVDERRIRAAEESL